MDLLVRLFLRLGVLLEMPAPRQDLRPIPVPACTLWIARKILQMPYAAAPTSA